MGTATYLAPEQAQGGPLDARTDIYALGCVTYEMLTGKPPFEGESAMNIAYKQVNEQPVAPRRRNPQVPEALDAIVMTCLAKQPGRRYTDAEAMRADLVRFRKNLPVSVAPDAALAATAVAASPGTTVMPIASAPVVVAGGAAQPPYTDPYADPEPFARRTGTLVGILIALVVVLAGLMFALFSQFGLLGGGDSTEGRVAIPTGLSGLTEADARARLEALGFVVTTEFEQGNTAAQGTVLRTNPEEGELADKGSTIRLIVSGGEVLIDIPNVVGTQFSDAQLVLTRAGFKVERIDQASETIAAGVVISQDPIDTEQAPSASTVRVTVSTGPPALTVPDVKNKDATTASNELGQAGFKVATQVEASSTVNAGQVIRTDPSAGAQVAKGTTITLYVSSGPAKVAVPNVVGKSEDEARGALEALGFTVIVQETNAGSPADVGKVLFQSPSANTQSLPGAEVTITIGAAVPETTI
jgi:serine/threonine-protein kinase